MEEDSYEILLWDTFLLVCATESRDFFLNFLFYYFWRGWKDLRMSRSKKRKSPEREDEDSREKQALKR